MHFPFFEEHGASDRDHVARPARPEGSAGSLSALAALSPGFHLDDQRRPLPWRTGSPRCLTACAKSSIIPSPQPEGGYLAFLGRISPEKRPDRAIAIAKRAGLRLEDRRQGRRRRPRLLRGARSSRCSTIPLIEFVGEIGDGEKSAFLGNAEALLFPIDWPEPFGLVMIEAMACGTPVIAWRCGSVPEIVDHGVTGFIVDVGGRGGRRRRTGARPRPARRSARVFERRFASTVMARNYVTLYRRAGP